MSYLEIGRITIPAIWIIVIGAVFISSFLYRVALKEKVGEWVGNAFFTYILVWKLSYILFNFSLVSQMPLSIVYFNGGIKGHFLGILAVIIYVIVVAKKKPRLYMEVPYFLLLFFATYEFMNNLANENIIIAIVFLVIIIIQIVLHRKKAEWIREAFTLLFVVQLLLVTINDSISSITALTFIGFYLLSMWIKFFGE